MFGLASNKSVISDLFSIVKSPKLSSGENPLLSNADNCIA